MTDAKNQMPRPLCYYSWNWRSVGPTHVCINLQRGYHLINEYLRFHHLCIAVLIWLMVFGTISGILFNPNHMNGWSENLRKILVVKLYIRHNFPQPSDPQWDIRDNTHWSHSWAACWKSNYVIHAVLTFTLIPTWESHYWISLVCNK